MRVLHPARHCCRSLQPQLGAQCAGIKVETATRTYPCDIAQMYFRMSGWCVPALGIAWQPRGGICAMVRTSALPVLLPVAPRHGVVEHTLAMPFINVCSS